MGNEPSFLLGLQSLRLPLGPHVSSRTSVRRPGQLEVNLLLEGIHLCHLHLDFIAQFDNAPCAPA
jgi:hypothetical protein